MVAFTFARTLRLPGAIDAPAELTSDTHTMSDAAIDDLLNIMRREAGRGDSLRKHSQTLLVSSYDPKAHAIKGTYQPDGKESGWVPIGTSQIGGGYGLAIGPKVGDQFEIAFRGGDVESPYVVGRLYSDKDVPPKVESGEAKLRHESGSQIFLNKDGEVLLTQKDGAHVNLTKDGAVEIGDKKGNKVRMNGTTAEVTLQDGTTIILESGKIYLGGKTNAFPVSTTGGPSSIVLAKV